MDSFNSAKDTSSSKTSEHGLPPDNRRISVSISTRCNVPRLGLNNPILLQRLLPTFESRARYTINWRISFPSGFRVVVLISSRQSPIAKSPSQEFKKPAPGNVGEYW